VNEAPQRGVEPTFFSVAATVKSQAVSRVTIDIGPSDGFRRILSDRSR
jgi:hypothetical protein